MSDSRVLCVVRRAVRVPQRSSEIGAEQNPWNARDGGSKLWVVRCERLTWTECEREFASCVLSFSWAECKWSAGTERESRLLLVSWKQLDGYWWTERNWVTIGGKLNETGDDNDWWGGPPEWGDRFHYRNAVYMSKIKWHKGQRTRVSVQIIEIRKWWAIK